MKTLLVSALALGALSSTALAEPVKLTSAQMDGVTAGLSITLTASSSVTVSQSQSQSVSTSASSGISISFQ